MDANHVEPGDWVYESEPWVQKLLRRVHGPAAAGHGQQKLRERIQADRA